jgi:DNA-binding transcriptional regulator YhcF (GntR family)
MPHPKSVVSENTLKLFSGVNIHSNTAVYIQIENLVLLGVAAGHLKPNDKLPSVREMSERFKVNPNTISNVYRELEIRGIIKSRRGIGAYVTKDAKRIGSELCREQVINRYFEVSQEALASGISKAELMNIVKECIKYESGPYSEVPRELLKAYKSK